MSENTDQMRLAQLPATSFNPRNTDPLGKLSCLPLELRNEIYALVLSFNEDNYPRNAHDNEGPWRTYLPLLYDNILSLLLASKTIHCEASKVLVRVNNFHVYLHRTIGLEDAWDAVSRNENPYLPVLQTEFTIAVPMDSKRPFFKSFTAKQKAAILKTELFKEIRTLSIHTRELVDSDLDHLWRFPEGLMVPEVLNRELTLALENVVTCFEKSSLAKLSIELEGNDAIGSDIELGKEVLEVFSRMRNVRKCEISVKNSDKDEWPGMETYKEYLRDTMKLPWGANAPARISEKRNDAEAEPEGDEET